MTGTNRRIDISDVLRYRDGERRSSRTVRAAYLQWRAQQTPAIPERCDNATCMFYTQPLHWNGRPIDLVLDHANGVNTDNTPENLRFLCPNCDSQNPDTKGGANKGRVVKSPGGFSRKRRDSDLKDYTLKAETGKFVLMGQAVNLDIQGGGVPPKNEDSDT